MKIEFSGRKSARLADNLSVCVLFSFFFQPFLCVQKTIQDGSFSLFLLQTLFRTGSSSERAKYVAQRCVQQQQQQRQQKLNNGDSFVLHELLLLPGYLASRSYYYLLLKSCPPCLLLTFTRQRRSLSLRFTAALDSGQLTSQPASHSLHRLRPHIYTLSLIHI